MTIGDARCTQRMINAVLSMRNQPLARTNEICDDALCWTLITMADHSAAVLRKAGNCLVELDGDSVRRSWPKPDGWEHKRW